MSTSAAARMGSYLSPSFEHARVSDAMRPRVLACPPGTALRDVARLMTTEHVHSVVVVRDRIDASGLITERPWAIVTDLDVLRCADRVDELTAGDAPTTELLTVRPGDTLADAAHRMTEHGVTHAVVVSPADGHPIGMLSSLDVAGVVAWGLA